VKAAGAALLLIGATHLVGCASPRLSTPAASGGAPTIDGYRRVVSGDRTLYCRSDEVLGSKVRRPDVCYEEAALKNNADAAQEFLRNARNAIGEQSASPPSGAR
jgi:hypothetical protein